MEEEKNKIDDEKKNTYANDKIISHIDNVNCNIKIDALLDHIEEKKKTGHKEINLYKEIKNEYQKMLNDENSIMLEHEKKYNTHQVNNNLCDTKDMLQKENKILTNNDKKKTFLLSKSKNITSNVLSSKIPGTLSTKKLNATIKTIKKDVTDNEKKKYVHDHRKDNIIKRNKEFINIYKGKRNYANVEIGSEVCNNKVNVKGDDNKMMVENKQDGEHFVNKENVQNNIIDDDDDDDDDNHHDNVVVVYDKVKENEMNENKNKKSVKEDGLHNVLVELRNKDNLVVNDNIINKSFEKNNILYIKTSDSLNENYNERKIYKEINKEEYSNKNEYVHFKNNDDSSIKKKNNSSECLDEQKKKTYKYTIIEQKRYNFNDRDNNNAYIKDDTHKKEKGYYLNMIVQSEEYKKYGSNNKMDEMEIYNQHTNDFNINENLNNKIYFDDYEGYDQEKKKKKLDDHIIPLSLYIL
ncbi:hypothetical protein PFNF54_00438 [Plasmodium falciparum NF54]|uniref:Uncharacterized protein n=1 Tax=Plasmodium falciparum (isolate NF54) TaxID=5843 RepID=W7K0J4_PLAFO|nr:hypothetical protein PFNF54_00438 [Plasmodium falciparum NF54]